MVQKVLFVSIPVSSPLLHERQLQLQLDCLNSLIEVFSFKQRQMILITWLLSQLT